MKEFHHKNTKDPSDTPDSPAEVAINDTDTMSDVPGGDAEEIVYVSKSQLKREMHELQELGKRLADLNEQQRASFVLTEELLSGIEEYRRVAKNEAKRRLLQYIGKQMRKQDLESIHARFAEMDAEQTRTIKRHHLVEQWRDRLLENNSEDVTAFLNEYPDTDRQTFRQLVRNAVKEQGNGKPPANTRKLFKFLRDTML
ncbi:ribosome biogenesis factor YjgA [Aurantivibrio plasticivorans]